MRLQKCFNIGFTVTLFLAAVLCAIFVFPASYERFGESCEDFGLSVGYYFTTLFKSNDIVTPSVTEYSDVLQWNILLPEEWGDFKQEAEDYFTNLGSEENIAAYGEKVGKTSAEVAKIVVLILPCVIMLCLFVKWIYMRSNTKHNQDTIPLKLFRKASNLIYHPIKRLFKEYASFLREYKSITIVWLVLWLFNLNLPTIILEFFAFYLYFALSYDVGNIYVQICKLLIDLQVIFEHFPWWIIAFLGWLIFNKFRKRIAVNRLRHFEARNCGFINELPIVSMACGSMGKKKTTLITDMILSQEVMFRQKALSIIQNADMKYPYFPWIAFEDELRACMEHRTVYNLASAKAWVALKKSRFERHNDVRLQLYGYDYKRYGDTFDNALGVQNLFDALETYAKAYFIYVMHSSLIMANYSIRTDNALADAGNFPMWLTDFFPEKRRMASRYAHILDFDVLRLGKKVMKDNPKAGSFEFGVVGITEIGKERCNNLELKEVKKGGDETNQKNDLFNSWLKMCRHSATVDNFPFIKVFTDEQRPESWGADARDLCDVIYIVSAGETRLALPFYTIEGMLSEWVFNKFISLYYDFRFRRGDNTLLVHFLKTITAWLWRRNLRIYNKYGYCVLKIDQERGTMDGKTERKKYFLMSAKIYAERFSTDCFSDYFNDMAKNSKTGLIDYIEYATQKASVEELKKQNSYFINGLYKDEDGNGSA